jgi:ribosomal-protein-alanine N-acetyltransferase
LPDKPDSGLPSSPRRKSLRIRPYREEDFEAVYRLDEVCFEPEFRFSRASMRRFLTSRRARVVVAEIAERLIGVSLVHVESAGDTALGYVVTLDVDPGSRRMGVARALLLASEAQACAEDCRAMVLHVFAENRSAIEFYESMGYRAGHTVEDFYGAGLDAVVYRKRLQPR